MPFKKQSAMQAKKEGSKGDGFIDAKTELSDNSSDECSGQDDDPQPLVRGSKVAPESNNYMPVAPTTTADNF